MGDLVKVFLGLPSEGFEPPKKIGLKTIVSDFKKNVTRGHKIMLLSAQDIILHQDLGRDEVGFIFYKCFHLNSI